MTASATPPRTTGRRAHALLLVLATVAAAVPFEVARLNEEVALPLVDLVSLLGLYALFRLRFDIGVTMLIAGLAAAFVSVLAVGLALGPEPRAALSWAYFTKPHLAFFAGVLAAERPAALRDFLRLWTLVFGAFCLASGWLVVEDADRLRRGYDLFGIPVFGVYGTNAFAVFLSLGGMLAYALAEKADVRLAERIAAGLVAIVAFALVIVSLSRQSALAVLLFAAVAVLRLVITAPKRGLSFGVLAVLAAIVLVETGAVDLDRWTDRLKWTNEGFATADADLLTSGRTEIWRGLLFAISQSPIFGTGFLGWAFPSENWQQAEWLEQGLSPHNQWLGTLWRMGLVPGAIYFAALLIVGARALSRPLIGADPWTLRLIIVMVATLFAGSQDVLTYPLTGGLTFLLLGLMYGPSRATGLPDILPQRQP